MFDSLPIATILISYVALLFSLCVHEASHAGAAYLMGDDTAARLGRLTLNPAPHIDLIGTVVFPLLGLFFGGFFIGWAKPVPFDPGRLTRKLQLKVSAALISFAGPAANLILSVIFVALTSLAIRWTEPDLVGRLTLFRAAFSGPESLMHLGLGTGSVVFFGLTGMLVRMNVLLAVFNLIPLGPLDGAGVLGGFLPNRVQYKYNRFRYHPYTWIGLMVLMISGIGAVFFRPIQALAYWCLSPIASLLLGV